MSGEPSISVVVNTCDRCPQLRTLLYALHHQTYRAFEVVVVLGPTHDDSEAMIAAELAGRVHLVRCPEFNLSVSRNLGLAHAAGEVVAFIDDDAVPAPRWLEQLAAAYAADPEVAGVGGRTYLIHPDRMGEVQFLSGRVSVLAEQEDVRWDDAAPPTSATPRSAWFPRFHGTNMSYRVRALLAIGGFDERFEYLFDDADVAVRLGLAGYRLEQLRQGVVYHVPATGRHRGEESIYNLNWYSWLRSTVYFALKNGPPTVGRRRSLAKAADHVAHFYTVVGDLGREGKLPPDLCRKARVMLRRGWAEGFATGLFGRRHIPGFVERVERPLLPFSRRGGRPLPAIAPTGLGRQENVKTLDDEPLCVCLLSAGYPPRSTEGVARSTHTLARGLAELGHEVHVVTAGAEHRVAFRDGAYVHAVRPPPNPHYAVLAGAGCPDLRAWLDYSHAVYEEVRALRRNHPVQIVDSALWNLDGLVTAVSGVVPVAVRVVTAMKQISETFHTRQSAEHRLLGELEGKFLEMAAAVISNTEASARTIEEVYGFDLASTVHGVVLYGIVPVPESEIAEPAPGGDGETTVLFVGRLESRKGVLDLFEAIPEVLKEHPRTRFVIAGSDNSTQDGFRARYGMDYPSHFRRRYPRAADRVDFLGFVDEEELARLYRTCDVFVAPSLYESFGLIFLEAMNYARPTIGCAAGGPKEVIADGETGFLVPPADAASLAAAIRELVADPRRRRDMGRAGRERLLRRFTHTQMAAGFVDVYRRALAGGRGAS